MGDFDFNPEVIDDERREALASGVLEVEPLLESAADWPTFRANNQGTARYSYYGDAALAAGISRGFFSHHALCRMRSFVSSCLR